MSSTEAQQALTALSNKLDDSIAWSVLNELHLHRVIKVAEEAGEAVAALIGWLGSNPRKGQTHMLDDVVGELLDTAVAALGAAEHLLSFRGESDTLALLEAKVITVAKRIGAVP